MNLIEFSISSDDENNYALIHSVADQIKGMNKKIRIDGKVAPEFYNNLDIFNKNIAQTVSYWVGHTFIGVCKEKISEKAFQHFWANFYDLILKMKKCGDNNLQQDNKKLLYQGKIYRWLVFDDEINIKYNEIYSSWSKTTNITYNMYEKLSKHKTIVLIEGFIPKSIYGIDLYNYTKGKPIESEQEVVFPMFCETTIKYEEVRNLKDYIK